MTARILLTGATGFVGSHVAAALVAAGHEVRCTVRATSDTTWLEGVEAERVPLELGREWEARRVVGGVDHVLHLAGLTRARRSEEFHRVNVEGTLELARAAIAAGARRFVFVSSLAARGPDEAPGPTSPYGLSKLEAERRLSRVGGGMEVVVLRPGGVYGPRDPDLLPLFRMAARGWLPIPRDAGPLQPVYVDDVVRAVRAVLEDAPGFGPHPVLGEDRCGWDAVVRALERALGRSIRPVPVPSGLVVAAGALAETLSRVGLLEPGLDRRRARDLAVHRYTGRSSSALRKLGWSPRVALSEGLERTARWYRERGWLRS